MVAKSTILLLLEVVDSLRHSTAFRAGPRELKVETSSMGRAIVETVDVLILIAVSIYTLVALYHVRAMWNMRKQFLIALRYGVVVSWGRLALLDREDHGIPNRSTSRQNAGLHTIEVESNVQQYLRPSHLGSSGRSWQVARSMFLRAAARPSQTAVYIVYLGRSSDALNHNKY